jgi:predicted  nucleic acid-binding Zn ribbon protein
MKNKLKTILRLANPIVNIFIIKIIYFFYRIKLKKIKLKNYICCPRCHSDLIFNKNSYECTKCNNIYHKHKGYYDFRLKGKRK